MNFDEDHRKQEENRGSQDGVPPSQEPVAAWYKSVFEHHRTVMLIIHPETGKILHANQAAADYYGWDLEELLQKSITEINTLNQEGVENLQSTLRACSDLEQQAVRLKQLVGSFRI